MYAKKEKIYPVYVSKHNLNRKKQDIFLMIPNGEGWHYLAAIKETIDIIKRNNIKRNGDFYCLNCLHSFRTKNRLELLKKVCENKDFFKIIMPSNDTKILEFN